MAASVRPLQSQYAHLQTAGDGAGLEVRMWRSGAGRLKLQSPVRLERIQMALSVTSIQQYWQFGRSTLISTKLTFKLLES